jgi:hypothetical protein
MNRKTAEELTEAALKVVQAEDKPNTLVHLIHKLSKKGRNLRTALEALEKTDAQSFKQLMLSLRILEDYTETL